MVEEVIEKWKNFDLTEKERTKMASNRRESINEVCHVEYCLFGKLLTDRSFNRKGLFNLMKKLWKPLQGMKAQEISGNIFVFKFQCQIDFRRVVEGVPWTFHDYLLVLKDFDGRVRPSGICFDYCKFWVVVEDVPLFWRNEETARFIGDTIGSFVSVDRNSVGLEWAESFRIRVNLDLRKPLLRCVNLVRGDEEEDYFMIRYERMPQFCYICGIIGHGLKDCGKSWSQDDYPYGGWMRREEKGSKEVNAGKGSNSCSSSVMDNAEDRRSKDWTEGGAQNCDDSNDQGNSEEGAAACSLIIDGGRSAGTADVEKLIEAYMGNGSEDYEMLLPDTIW